MNETDSAVQLRWLDHLDPAQERNALGGRVPEDRGVAGGMAVPEMGGGHRRQLLGLPARRPVWDVVHRTLSVLERPAFLLMVVASAATAVYLIRVALLF